VILNIIAKNFWPTSLLSNQKHLTSKCRRGLLYCLLLIFIWYFIASILTRICFTNLILHRYYRRCSRARLVGNVQFLLKAFPPIVTKILWKLGFEKLYRDVCLRKTSDVLKECGIPKDAIGGICYSWGDYGTTPGDSAFFIQAFMESHYNHGAYFPLGGSKSIAKTIVASIERRGGKVFASAPVEKILTERSSLWGSKATGVRVHGIDISVRKAVVSDVGFTKTFEVGLNMDPPLVDQSVGASQLALVHTKDVKYHFRPSPAFFYLFVGLEGSEKDLHLPGQVSNGTIQYFIHVLDLTVRQCQS